MDAGCIRVLPIAQVPYDNLTAFHKYSSTSVKSALPPCEVLEPIKPPPVLVMVLSLAGPALLHPFTFGCSIYLFRECFQM